MHPLEGHLRVGLAVVVEFQVPQRRLPGSLRVTALAAHEGLAYRPMRLIFLVAVAATLALADEDSQALPVGPCMAFLAVDDLMFCLECPARLRVVEVLLAADCLPAHQVETAASMILVALLAGLTSYQPRGVKALICLDSFAQIFVIMAAETFVAVHALTAVVASVALVLPIQARVTGRELTWR